MEASESRQAPTAVPAPGDPQAVGRRIAAASDERRRHVERVLHDGVQQHLALLGLKLSMLQKQIRTDPEAAEELCVDLHQEIQSALAELRNVALLVYPALLDNEGLAAALQRAAARFPVAIDVAVQEQIATPPELVAPLYFCAVESIELVAPYAHEPMSLCVVVAADTICLDLVAPVAEVSMDVLEHAMGYIADRVTALGGTVGVDTSAKGVRIAATVPMRAASARS